MSTKITKIPPPDGGWGWVVVFGSFMISFVADGVSYGYLGLLVAEIDKTLKTGKSAASWIGSISLGFTFGSGPIAGAFVDRYGCRAVSIAGIVIAAFGFAISYFATNVYHLYVSIGLTGGVGLGLLFLPSVVCVTWYFEKRRAFATGIAVAGSGIGSFVCAPIYSVVIKKLGWKMSSFVVGGVMLLTIGFAALFRPLPSEKLEREDENTFVITASDNMAGPESGSITIKLKKGVEDLSTVDLIADGLTATMTVETTTSVSIVPKVEPLEAEEQAESFNEVTTPIDKQPHGACASFIFALRSSVDFKLLLIPAFAVFAVSNFLTDFGTNVPYIQLADLAMHNLNRKDGDATIGLIVGSVGISNSICRIVLGYLSDKKWMNRLHLYSVSLILAGAGATSHARSVETMTVCALLFGATGGLYVGLTSVVLADLLGMENLNRSFGIVLMFQGVGTVIGAPIVGAIYDTLGSYIYGFWLAGGVISLSGAMLLVIPCLERRRHLQGLEKDETKERLSWVPVASQTSSIHRSVVAKQENLPPQ